MTTTPALTPTPADLIAEYIWLRDNKQNEEKKFEQWVDEKYSARMRDIEMSILGTLNMLGTDSITAHGIGNAHRKLKTSVTIADMREFQRYVIGSAAWELVDWRANKTAVNAIVDKNDPLPPGVNYSAIYTIGVRKG